MERSGGGLDGGGGEDAEERAEEACEKKRGIEGDEREGGRG
jgi:hypothetical protein